MFENTFKLFRIDCKTTLCKREPKDVYYYPVVSAIISWLVSVLFWPLIVSNVYKAISDRLKGIDHHTYCHICHKDSLEWTYKTPTIGELLVMLVGLPLGSLVLGLVVIGAMVSYPTYQIIMICALVVVWSLVLVTQTGWFQNLRDNMFVHENCRNCINPQAGREFCLNNCVLFSELQLPPGVEKLPVESVLTGRAKEKYQPTFITNRIWNRVQRSNIFVSYFIGCFIVVYGHTIAVRNNIEEVYNYIALTLLLVIVVYFSIIAFLKSDYKLAQKINQRYKHYLGIHEDLHYNYAEQLKKHKHYVVKACSYCPKAVMLDGQTGEVLLNK